ncbi:hypothetical protein PV08_01607 [Exophiala spinifera]|uniref:UBC core domain-containing protein n=1 Tax=Exophiala spinifera TaxID=91928 RepID=A0A0D2BQ23_9EURO|nr:uncharacterized protein PV08_01607 [Exophiala spinifera]KIW21028.1 hypothetical protein PV08_01607 [Exophiala spinifera]
MAPSPTMRRLLKETAELSSPSSNPNPAFYAGPVSDEDLHEWHFTLLGPPSPSPYEGGMYHGRITLPPSYPLKPPNFRFLTPSGRFEVNREICLSISGFHEETWMPAWGVRTALTALRSFMAEKGTAGQVGGLEASVDVRKRLARESRAWKCEACRKSNEAIMGEWWEVCRQNGVNVQEEEGVQLETLPEGITLEPRSPGPQDEKRSPTNSTPAPADATSGPEQVISAKTDDKGKGRADAASPPAYIKDENIMSDNAQQQSRVPTSHPETVSSTSTGTSTSTPSQTQNTSTAPDSNTSLLQPPQQQQHHHPHPSPPPPRMIPTPSAEAAQASAEAVLTPSDLSSSSPSSGAHRPSISLISGIHAPPLTAANAALQNSNSAAPLILQRDRARESVTIDRAIAGVFLALCLMVLKKIFYPAGSTNGAGFGGGVDDFYLQRE